jgi:queuine/archaeosine tRNA-ribosyltransferase
MMEGARRAIEEGDFRAFKEEFLGRYGFGKEEE